MIDGFSIIPATCVNRCQGKISGSALSITPGGLVEMIISVIIIVLISQHQTQIIVRFTIERVEVVAR